MSGYFEVRLLSLIFIAAGVVAAQSPPPKKDIPAIAKAANGAIVTIITAANDKPIAQGTGFLVSADGVIVTNYHVIETGNVAIVKFPDGTVLPIDGVLAADKVRDLAVIKIHGKTFRTLTLGNSDHVQVGEEVVAIGNPLSLESTVSNGIVSGMRTSKEQGGKFLQTTAPISPGSSGGPLFNMRGEVVGINTLYLDGGENLNFAIPVNDARRLLLKQNSALRNLPNEAEPKETLKDSHEDTSSQQKACDEQSEKFARYQRQETQDNIGVPLRSGYTNHYYAKVNKCYVETTFIYGDGKKEVVVGTHDRYFGQDRQIGDAFSEGHGSRFYGSFSADAHQCIIQSDGGVITCRSVEEFDELALKYFGTDAKTIHVHSYDKDGNEVP
jgi:Trypsin-like peptidase domain